MNDEQVKQLVVPLILLYFCRREDSKPSTRERFSVRECRKLLICISRENELACVDVSLNLFILLERTMVSHFFYISTSFNSYIDCWVMAALSSNSGETAGDGFSLAGGELQRESCPRGYVKNPDGFFFSYLLLLSIRVCRTAPFYFI